VQNDQELLGYFQVEFPESVLTGQRDLVKVDREMGAEIWEPLWEPLWETWEPPWELVMVEGILTP
jgi:hypothetical protein